VLLLVFVATFLVPLSVHPWHFHRWLIPVLPACALCAAYGLTTAVAAGAQRLRLSSQAHAAVLVIGVCLAVAEPVGALVRMHRAYAQPSTYVVARQWIEENLPVGSYIAYEWETLPMPLVRQSLGPGVWINRHNDRNFSEVYMSKLSVRGTPGYYARAGYKYLVTSSLMYDVYPADAAHYPTEAAFYRELMSSGRLLKEVHPSGSSPGPAIRIYELP
jgi:hypothetical protein